MAVKQKFSLLYSENYTLRQGGNMDSYELTEHVEQISESIKNIIIFKFLEIFLQNCVFDKCYKIEITKNIYIRMQFIDSGTICIVLYFYYKKYKYNDGKVFKFEINTFDNSSYDFEASYGFDIKKRVQVLKIVEKYLENIKTIDMEVE